MQIIAELWENLGWELNFVQEIFYCRSPPGHHLNRIFAQLNATLWASSSWSPSKHILIPQSVRESLWLHHMVTCLHKTRAVKLSVKSAAVHCASDISRRLWITVKELLLPARRTWSDPWWSTRTTGSWSASILGPKEVSLPCPEDIYISQKSMRSCTYPVFSYRILSTVQGVTNRTGVPENQQTQPNPFALSLEVNLWSCRYLLRLTPSQHHVLLQQTPLGQHSREEQCVKENGFYQQPEVVAGHEILQAHFGEFAHHCNLCDSYYNEESR